MKKFIIAVGCVLCSATASLADEYIRLPSATGTPIPPLRIPTAACALCTTAIEKPIADTVKHPEPLYRLPMNAGWIFLSRVTAVLPRIEEGFRPHVDVIITQPNNSPMDITIWLGTPDEAIGTAAEIAMERNETAGRNQ